MGQPATLTCSSDFSGDMISSIEWLNAESTVEDMTSKQQSLVLAIDTTTDNLTNTTYTCNVTHINGTVFMHNIVLSVEGELLVLTVEVRGFIVLFVLFSVPSNPISVVISPAPGSTVAGETYSLVCSVTEDVAGLTGSPSVHWIGPDDSTAVSTTGNIYE